MRDSSVLPLRATTGAAGFDIFADLQNDLVIPSGSVKKVPSGVSICMPDALSVAILVSRSGLAVKKEIVLANGVGIIDSDYRGEVIVALRNFGKNDYIIKPGERVAQLLFFNLTPVSLAETEQPFDDTVRGSGGFGSTGL